MSTNDKHFIGRGLRIGLMLAFAMSAVPKSLGVLPPFVALHIGAALAHPDVGSVATYDVQLAQVSALHGLTVVSPGWPSSWWEREG